jgi:hypothetical protein
VNSGRIRKQDSGSDSEGHCRWQLSLAGKELAVAVSAMIVRHVGARELGTFFLFFLFLF